MSLLEEIIEVMDKNAMLEEQCEVFRKVRELYALGHLSIIVKEPHPHACSNCGEVIAKNTVGRRFEWPNYCPYCGKKAVFTTPCKKPVYQ